MYTFLTIFPSTDCSEANRCIETTAYWYPLTAVIPFYSNKTAGSETSCGSVKSHHLTAPCLKSIPKFQLPFLFYTVQLPRSVLQILCFLLVLLRAVPEFTHPTGVGTPPHVSELASPAGVLEGLTHVRWRPFGVALDEHGAEVEAGRCEAAGAGLLVVLPGQRGVGAAVQSSPVVGQQTDVMACVYRLLSSSVAGAHEAGVGSFQTLGHSTW